MHRHRVCDKEPIINGVRMFVQKQPGFSGLRTLSVFNKLLLYILATPNWHPLRLQGRHVQKCRNWRSLKDFDCAEGQLALVC